MKNSLNILFLGISEERCQSILLELRKGTHKLSFESVSTESQLHGVMQQQSRDVVIMDGNPPEWNALGAIAVLKKLKPELPVLIMTDPESEEGAVECMRAGARDYFFNSAPHRLLPAIERELRNSLGLKSHREAAAALQSSEEDLRQAQKMEAVGRLAGGVAHDFNNVLAAIILYSEAVYSRLPDDESLRSDVTEIKKSAERAASLVRQLLAFSRKQVIQPQAIDLNATIQGMANMFQQLIGEHIELTAKLDPNVGTVFVDPWQIEQLLFNLVVNARDAMPRGGVLQIGTEEVSTLRGESQSHRAKLLPGRYVMLFVNDSGCGMTAEVQAKIFEPFFTTKPVGEGTGLGLSTVYGIVQKNDGVIDVKSAVGKGTQFKVYLPESFGAISEALPEVAFSKPVVAAAILLVEDDEAVRSALKETLTLKGYEILTARNGEEAAALCLQRKGRIDLLITDVVMPRMNGIELVSRVGRLYPEMKVLFMSGYTKDSAILRDLEDENVRFLAKPFGPQVILEKIQDILRPRDPNSNDTPPII